MSKVFSIVGALGLGVLLSGCIVLPSATGLDTQSLEGIKVGSTTRQEIRERFGKLIVHLEEGRFAVYQATTNQVFFAGLFAGGYQAGVVGGAIPTGNASTYRILVEFNDRDVVSRYVIERTGYFSDVESRSVDEQTGDIKGPATTGEPPRPRALLGKYYVNSLAFSGDGQKLAGGTGNRVLLWDLSREGEPVIFKGECSFFCLGHVSSVSISPDGKTVVAVGMDNLAAVFWDVGTGKVLWSIPRPGPVPRLVMTPDGTIVAAGVKAGVVTWWDISTGKELESIKAQKEGGTSIAMSPDNTRLVTFGEDRVYFWDLLTGQKLTAFNCPASYCAPLRWKGTFSPDGKLVAITDGRGVEVRRFLPKQEARSVERAEGKLPPWSSLGELVAVFILPALTGLDSDPRYPRPALAFSPDGRRLAASYNSVALIWDVTTRRELWRYLPYSVNAVIPRDANIKFGGEIPLAWSPDGKSLATSVIDAWSGSNHSVALWDVPMPKETVPDSK